MNKILTLASLLLLLSACEKTEAPKPEVATQSALAAAIEVQQLMLAGDVEATLRPVPPELFIRGRENWEAAISMADQSREATMHVAREMEFVPPRAVHSVGERSVCAIPWTSTIQERPVRSYFLGVSDDGGETWAFINGSDGVLEWWRENAPELIAPLETEVGRINGWIKEGVTIERDRQDEARQPR